MEGRKSMNEKNGKKEDKRRKERKRKRERVCECDGGKEIKRY